MPPSTISDSDVALWVTSSGTPTLRRLSWQGWKNRPWSRLLFGQETLRMSDGSPGVERWISSQRGSPASRGRPPESSRAPTTSGGSGLPSWMSFARWNRGWYSLKTSGDLFQAAGSIPYSEPWPISGSMRNGECWPREPLAPATGASGFSFWPSARAEGSESCGNHPGATDSLTGATAGWMTPSANLADGNGYTRGRGQRGAERPTLVGQSMMWATATAHDGRRSGPDLKSTMGGNLSLDAALWPTPAARDVKGDYSDEAMVRKDGKVRDDLLPNVASRFSPQGQPIPSGSTSSPSTPAERRRLNPAFVCWLMGWPWFWTRAEPISCGAQETALWRSRLRALLSRWPGASS